MKLGRIEVLAGTAEVAKIAYISLIVVAVLAVRANASDYRAIEGVDCYITAVELGWNAEQFMVSGSGVELLCGEQNVPLVDGEFDNGWLATREFGRIRIKNVGGLAIEILVTPKQNAFLRERYNPTVSTKVQADETVPVGHPDFEFPAENDYDEAVNAYGRGDYSWAAKKFFSLSEGGDSRAQVWMGNLYKDGHGVSQDYAEAVKWYGKSAMQGNADGQMILGYMYHVGKGVAPDDAEAMKWYRKAAVQGHAFAQNNLGWMYETGQGVAEDYAEAAKWYGKSAVQGDATGQKNLGSLYERGLGVTEDYAEALKWYRKAAVQGHAFAQNHLGRMYQHGQGVAEDYTEAVKWYRKAAEQGNAGAQGNLGVMYRAGRGVAQNDTRAAELFGKACDGGDTYGCFSLGALYEDGRGVTQNYARAVELYRKACGGGHMLSCGLLGFMYDQGTGVPQDDARAVELYRQACDGGEMVGCSALGDMHADGEGVSQNAGRAVELYREACDGGWMAACNSLGVMYARGTGVPQSDARASELYRQACDAGQAEGCSNLGDMDGEAVAQGNAVAQKNLNMPQSAPLDGRDAESRANLSSMLTIAGGVALLGKNDERTQVETFQIDKTEVTVKAYRLCVAVEKCERPADYANCTWNSPRHDLHPIDCVSWEDARDFCAWAGKRLPTDVEWEKAARGTDGREYPWGAGGFDGNGRAAVANICDSNCENGLTTYDDGWGKTAPVGSFPAGDSPYGVGDMVGNVAEYVDGLRATMQGVAVVEVRGTNWHDRAEDTKLSSRRGVAIGLRSVGNGFRCAR